MKRITEKITFGEIITTLLMGVLFLGCSYLILSGLAKYEYRPGSIHEPVGSYSQATGMVQEKPPMKPDLKSPADH